MSVTRSERFYHLPAVSSIFVPSSHTLPITSGPRSGGAEPRPDDDGKGEGTVSDMSLR